MGWDKAHCEYLRSQANQKFNQVRQTWIHVGTWALPHRINWLLSQQDGTRVNNHVVDPTHIISLRSCVAGFLEGNTSASRPWYRAATTDEEVNARTENKDWLQKFTTRTLDVLASGNFYHAAGGFYYDYHCFNTGSHYVDEMPNGGLYWHVLVPGSYKIINNAFGDAIIMVREFSLNVKALVTQYGKTKNGKPDWSNFSSRVRKLYEESNYTQMIDIVHIVQENTAFDPYKNVAFLNKPWVSLTYELGADGQNYTEGQEMARYINPDNPDEAGTFLKISASKRKPFIVGRSDTNGNFEYGLKGPTLDALGLIKSLNKKAIGKDQALEQMLKPALQGPSNLRKSYITTAPNSFTPLDATSLANKVGLRPIFEVNPGIGALVQDVSDLRQQLDKLYYADYLLYLSRNPKTRTATETRAIVEEQQLVIGPVLQSLNITYNRPVVEFVMDYCLFDDPWIRFNPPPDDLAGQFLHPEFISVFAQAQKAADLPSIERFVAMVEQVGQFPGGEAIWQKVNLDKLADLYEDRLYLPAGLNNPQAKVDAMREQAQAQARRQQMMQETIPALAGAAKDLGLNKGKETA